MRVVLFRKIANGRFRGVDIYVGRSFCVRDRGVGRVRGLVELEGISIMENIGKKIRRIFFGRVRGVGRVGGVWSRRGLPVFSCLKFSDGATLLRQSFLVEENEIRD